jgi:hypothetical protein
MHRVLRVALTACAALVGAGRPMPVAEAPQPVAEIADASLRDVAVAVYDPVHPVIYYNPDLLQRFSPELRAFFMAHERAHIALRHTRAGALRGQPGTGDQALQAKELEADCQAARELGPARRNVSLAAVRFFTRLGNNRFDSEHPTGAQRAARILACMPL